MDDQLLAFLVDDLIVDLCFEIHQQIKTVGMTLEELYEVDPLEKVDHAPIVPQSLVVSCSKCKRQVHASRYAPHLEKCLAGTRRQSTLARASTDDTASAS
ncbi:hypothetical protein Poli38472_002306 [Pythium oligandrum]|uniref:SAGA-associated factor 11 n=1 Tax=Pythium oligandrum TaxID=41045 RepID=A0A8K1CIK0_PYTOL|nr:hypothetical protein Poli38472_002306 [Pythium oligandrum]|eukprot:TMW63365.1 hypothetical protein Poli38472_002306 [Pythium oligandrum]